ncbi:Transposon Tf2-6 polyprotein, partial [Nosema granulosis]
IDTGATRNFLSQNALERLKNETTVTQKVNEHVVLADGSKSLITSKIILEGIFDFYETPKKIEFYILPELPYDGLIGIQTMKELKCVVDFNNGRILAQNSLGKTEEDNPDKILANKVNLPFYSDPEFTSIIENFKSENPKIGCIETDPINIPLKDTIPVCKRPYTISLPRIQQTKDEIQKLLELNIIRESNSSYASPAFPIPKKNGKTRLVVDYKDLNAKTIKLGYPFPNMQYSLIDLKGAKYFSQVDLNMGYYQIPMAEESIHKTAFVTPFGHYEFLRMPFGLSNAPRIFQQVMTSKLQKFPFAKVFVDDILIFSKSYEEHKRHVIEVISHLHKEGISVNFDKSSFLKTEVNYLGKIIDKDGIRADLDSLIGISKFKTPKNKKDLTRLLGKLNWFRNHVPGLSSHLIDITAKLKNENKQFSWSQKDDEAVDNILKIIKSQIVLHHPDISKPFTLKTDASDEGLGATLYQDGKLIGVYSNKLQKSELNYTTTEKELLAIIKALKHFKSIILGSQIKVLTDHKNLTYITSCENNRAQRWKGLLDEFNVELEYIEGKENSEADMFSRCLVIKPPKIKHTMMKIFDLAKLSEEQVRIENYTALEKIEIENYKIAVNENRRIIIPSKIAKNIIKHIHIKLGHPGRSKLFYTLCKAIVTDHLQEKIKLITESCKQCQTEKNSSSIHGKLLGNINAQEPYQKIAIDLYGPISTRYFKGGEDNDKIMLMVIVDVYSRWTEIIPTSSISAKMMIKLLTKTWFSSYGIPKEIISDQGKQFIANEFKHFLRSQNIKHTLSSIYNPTGNSVVERVNQTIGNVLRCSKSTTLSKAIKLCKKQLNYTYHSTLGVSPFEIIHQYNPLNPLIPINIDSEIVKEKKTKRSMNDQQKKNSKRIEYTYMVMQDVLIKNPFPDKLDTRWEGPYKITKVEAEKNYVIVKVKENEQRINIKRVKPFKREEHVVN